MCDPTRVTLYLQASPRTMLTSTCRRISRQLAVTVVRRSAVRSFAKSSVRSSDAIFVVSPFAPGAPTQTLTFRLDSTATPHTTTQRSVTPLCICSDFPLTRCMTLRLPSSSLQKTSRGLMRSFPTTRPSTGKQPSSLSLTLHSDRTEDGQASVS